MDTGVYLSVDFDYWRDATFKEAQRFLDRALALSVPVRVVDEHHHLLPHINEYRCPTIINVDAHADIVENDARGSSPQLDCGTWANHVQYTNCNRFIWVYPDELCIRGRCNTNSLGFCNNDPRRNPFYSATPLYVCGWKHVTMRYRRLPDARELTRVRAMGIATSWGWGTRHMARELRTYLKARGLKCPVCPR